MQNGWENEMYSKKFKFMSAVLHRVWFKLTSLKMLVYGKI